MQTAASADATSRPELMNREDCVPGADALCRCAFYCASPVLLVGLVNGFFASATKEDPIRFWLIDVFQWVLLPAICLTLARTRCRIGPVLYDLGSPRSLASPRLMLFTVASTGVFLTMVFPGYTLLWNHLWSIDDLIRVNGSYPGFAPTGILAVGILLYRSVTAGFVEEIFFRGLLKVALIGSVANNRNVANFLVISSILFGVAHWEQGVVATITLCVLGAFAGGLYLLCGSLWPLIVGHIITDIVIHSVRGI